MKKIIVTFLMLFSSNAVACSFLLQRSSAYPKLGSTVIILSISLWLLYYCYPKKKTLINIILLSAEAIPVFFIIKNWNEFAICASKVVLPAYIALIIALVILVLSFCCGLSKWLKIKRGV